MKINNVSTQIDNDQKVDHSRKHHVDHSSMDQMVRDGLDAKRLKLGDDEHARTEGSKPGSNDKQAAHDAKQEVTKASHAEKQAAHDAKQEVTKASHAEKQAAHAAKQAEHKSHKQHKAAGGDGENSVETPKPDDKAVPAPGKGVDTPVSDSPPADGSSKLTATGKLPPMTGEKIINDTITVKAGEVFDGKGMHFKAGPGIGDGGQSENQKPLFNIEPGGTIQNVQVSGGDGIHSFGDANLKNVWWRDVGEDAFTMKGPGNVKVEGGGAFGASDKVFQVNAPGSLSIDGFTADGYSKFVRQNGGKDFPLDVKVSNSILNGGEHGEGVFRTDSPQASVTLDGNTISNVKYDVSAPDGAQVVGATTKIYKPFTG